MKKKISKTAISSQEKKKEMQYEAEEIIKNIFREIKKDIPELVYAINILKLYPVYMDINISTDFTHLFYNPEKIILLKRKYRENTIKLQIMHILFHGLLGHGELVNSMRQRKELWLAEDQKVDEICIELGYMARGRIYDVIGKMKKTSPYKECFGNYYLAKENKIIRKKAKAAQREIALDNHFFWCLPYLEKVVGIPEEELRESKEGESDIICISESTLRKWKTASEIICGGLMNAPYDMSEKLKESLENKKNKNCGKGAGDSFLEIKESPLEPMDYKDVINEVIRELEDPREVPDSIDQMLYQYGLDLYGDVPLIEPKEGDMQKKLGTIVIAIDTSGSCSGEVAYTLVRELRGLLRSASDHIIGGKLLLIECDDTIQAVHKYEINGNGIEDYIPRGLHGYGGTDFRPVFEYIDVNSEELGKVDALMYLTDGWGEAPDEEPEYPVFFIMSREDIDEIQERNYLPSYIRYAVFD